MERVNPLLGAASVTPKAFTASAVLRALDANIACTNAGASGSVTITLPKATAGRGPYYFIRTGANAMSVAPQSADSIRGSGAGVATALTSNTLYMLVCVVAGTWEIPLPATGGGGGTFKSVDTPPASPTAYDDEFNASSLNAKWTWRNQTTATATFGESAIYLTSALDTTSVCQLITQPLPAGTAWKIRAKLSWVALNNPNGGGLCLFESATGKIYEFGVIDNSWPNYLWGRHWTNYTTSAGNAFLIGYPMRFWGNGTLEWIYLEIERAAGSLNFRWSPSGAESTFMALSNETVTTFFTTAPDCFGLLTRGQSVTTSSIVICDWIRQIPAGYDTTFA